ncbi:MAG TPA: transketolase C-terminal domain-containing protein [Actinomycetes bacterium]|jgi:pyruvate dehydrogenase E1 component beta subunit|nr:transketolase C-terminal domain-containing protein [Actinomycetes bacterium]
MTTVIEALRQGLVQEMERDGSVFVMGEDVGIGGSFHLTLGLKERFGPDRVRDTPVSEAGFVGLAVGAALAGLRPVVDFQYGDFLLCAADQVIQQACKLPYFSGGQVRVPLVLHAPTGASGRGAQHANSIENVFYGVPGLVLAVPSTAYDAKGVMASAVRCDGPVLVLSHKHLYGSKGRAVEVNDGLVGEVPAEPYGLEIGRAVVRRPGTDLTIVGALLMVHRALEATDQLAAEGISAEVVDLRWLAPLDVDTVVASVRRTGRLLLVEEGPGRGGWGGTVGAAVADAALGALDAPIRRLTGPATPMPFAPHLEAELVPSVDRILDEARRLVGGG